MPAVIPSIARKTGLFDPFDEAQHAAENTFSFGRHLRTLDPHKWGAARTGEQGPCFAGNVRPHEPRVGLRPENLDASLGDVPEPGTFLISGVIIFGTTK